MIFLEPIKIIALTSVRNDWLGKIDFAKADFKVLQSTTTPGILVK